MKRFAKTSSFNDKQFMDSVVNDSSLENHLKLLKAATAASFPQRLVRTKKPRTVK